MKIWKIIGSVILILILIYLISGIALSIISSSKCQSECEVRGTIFSDVKADGNFDLNDLCICYFPENKIDTFFLENG